jgi:hypothetical protein
MEGSKSYGTIQVIENSSASLMKTGLQTTFFSNDDGDLQNGRYTNFYELDFLNHFGTYKRFTGVSGGYYDRSDSEWKDVNGIITTRALAYPSSLACDWSTMDKLGNIVIYIANPEYIIDTVENAVIATAGATIEGLAVFRVANINEATNIQNKSLAESICYPEMYNVTYGAFTAMTSSLVSAVSTHAIKNEFGTVLTFNPKTAIRVICCRTTNKSEL